MEVVMKSMNIELTTCCPLHCPQCYCSLEGGKHIPLETAKQKLDEAAEHGVRQVQLSGGETLCYPHLIELVEYAAKRLPEVNVALSGWHFDEKTMEQLIEAGTTGIFISLNGSTEEINALTRDGYDYAISALELLARRGFPNTIINWVMHSNNAQDFEQMIRLAERYRVAALVVLAFKPDSRHELKSFPSAEQMYRVAGVIKRHQGNTKLMVETCFSQLLAILKDTKLFGNLNVGPLRGCSAGLSSYSINVDGLYSPCRHLDYFEEWPSLEDYIANSTVLETLRHAEKNPKEPCDGCRFKDYCRPCLAVNSKLHGAIYKGHEMCTVWKAGLQD